jgi:hypothetical protein
MSERRLTERYDVELPAVWMVTRRHRWRRVASPETATIVNISSTGLVLEADVADSVSVGDVVDVLCGDQVGTIRVRRISECDEPGVAEYAGDFVSPSRALLDLVISATPLGDRSVYERTPNTRR